jgi:hypothetical protein
MGSIYTGVGLVKLSGLMGLAKHNETHFLILNCLTMIFLVKGWLELDIEYVSTYVHPSCCRWYC